MNGYIEVRGIVNKDGTLCFGEFTQYDNEFGIINIYLCMSVQTQEHLRICWNTIMECVEIYALDEQASEYDEYETPVVNNSYVKSIQ